MSDAVQGCLGCARVADHSPSSAGFVFAGAHWRVLHAPGRVPLGALALITTRHCLSVADLSAEEAAELGPLLRIASACVMGLTEADEAHVEVWSHAQFVPGHLHFVLRPATAGAPHSAGDEPDDDAIRGLAARAQKYFAGGAA